MDIFKKASLNDYGYEMEWAKELGKVKLRKFEKKQIRKTSRKRLKQTLIKERWC